MKEKNNKPSVTDPSLDDERLKGEMADKTNIYFLQMEALRKNLDVQGNSLQDNYRPTQELNDRKVYYYTGIIKACPDVKKDRCFHLAPPNLKFVLRPRTDIELPSNYAEFDSALDCIKQLF